MSAPTTPGSGHRHPSAGTSRPAGVVVSLLTAGGVFAVGMAVLPPIQRAPAAPVPVAAPPPPPAPPPAVEAAAPVEAAAAEAAAAPAPAAAAPAAAAEEAAPRPPKPAAPPARERPVISGSATVPAVARKSDKGDKDKDIAREAWRKNLPDISVDKAKAAILIPIRGSIEGATYHISTKPHGVYVTLPQGESMITMNFYKIKHDGFRTLWIKQEENGATSFRLMLGDAYDPQVEIKDDFVRVTVNRPPPEETPVVPEAVPGDEPVKE